MLRSLRGVHLTFTGILSKPRLVAARAGKNAGLKLMEIKRLRAKGQRITLLNERQFWELAKGSKPARSR